MRMHIEQYQRVADEPVFELLGKGGSACSTSGGIVASGTSSG
jgi:hypothetical protein